jgi:organic hydroperoxide reductase OsmC/OhrA
MAEVHRYAATTAWQGSTLDGYAAYSRDHRGAAPPAQAELALSADPAFHGDPSRLNPEQLLVLAASSCQMLSFLAICARARLDIRAYEDEAVGVMPEDDPPMRITQVTLRPRITVAGDVDDERLHRYTQVAHRECFIASSLKTRIDVEPTFERV